MMYENINKDCNVFLKFLGKVTSLVFKSNLRIMRSSKSETFKDIEAWETFRYSCKKRMQIP